MEHIRVINFPSMKMVSSGPITTMDELTAFEHWWRKIDMKDCITPRDFMYNDEKRNCMIWLIAVPKGFIDADKYEMIDFPGGLFAVGTAKDGDDADMKRSKNMVIQWINDSGCFEVSKERHEMAHVCTPKVFKEKMGYHLTDFFVPIDVK